MMFNNVNAASPIHRRLYTLYSVAVAAAAPAPWPPSPYSSPSSSPSPTIASDSRRVANFTSASCEALLPVRCWSSDVVLPIGSMAAAIASVSAFSSPYATLSFVKVGLATSSCERGL
jgi:hypothetical protein